MAQMVKNLPAKRETWVLSLGWEDRLEKGKATYSGILAWRILWAIQSMGSQRVRLSDFHFHYKLGLLVSFYLNVLNLPQRMQAVIFNHIQFLCILLLQERCIQVQALHHCSKGSQVPACFKRITANLKGGQFCPF